METKQTSFLQQLSFRNREKFSLSEGLSVLKGVKTVLAETG
jgi:hypothetical protein